MIFYYPSYQKNLSEADNISIWISCIVYFSSVQLLSCVRLCDPMNCSTPGLPIHHQLLEFTQTHVHRVRDAIQPSHPLLSPSPPAPNPSQHQSLFQWIMLNILQCTGYRVHTTKIIWHQMSTATWINAQHHSLLEKCKSKLQWGNTSHGSEWPSSKIHKQGDGNVSWYSMEFPSKKN